MMKKRWMFFILGLACIFPAFAIDISEVVNGVEARFDLEVPAIPEIKSDQDRLAKCQRSMQIGAAYMEQGDMQDALRKFVYAYHLLPDSPDVLFMIGTILIEMKDDESAVAIFEYMEEKFPKDFRINNNLGWIYCTSDDPKFRDGRKAEKYATKALLYAPNDYHVWSTLAEARFVYGNYEDALRAAKQALMLAQSAEKDETELKSYKELLDKCQRAFDAEKEMAEHSKEQK